MALSTGNISLQDVVTEVGTTPDGSGKYTLLRSFEDAHTHGFNPTYRGAMNSLYNFKGYDHSAVESLSISPSGTVSLGTNSQQFTVTVSSNSTWSANLGTSPPSWITFTPSGTQYFNGTITVSVDSNLSTTARNAALRVVGETTSLILTISQDGTQ